MAAYIGPQCSDDATGFVTFAARGLRKTTCCQKVTADETECFGSDLHQIGDHIILIVSARASHLHKPGLFPETFFAYFPHDNLIYSVERLQLWTEPDSSCRKISFSIRAYSGHVKNVILDGVLPVNALIGWLVVIESSAENVHNMLRDLLRTRQTINDTRIEIAVKMQDPPILVFPPERPYERWGSQRE